MIVPAEGDFRLETEADTAHFGAALAGALQKGEAICLSGPLGAGKSVMARGLIRALSPAEGDVPSPTFTLVQFYQGPRFPVAHFDLYRIASPDEAYEIGLDEALRDGAAVIEWAEKLGHHLPANRLDVEFEVAEDGEADAGEGGGARRIKLIAHGAWEERALDL